MTKRVRQRGVRGEGCIRQLAKDRWVAIVSETLVTVEGGRSVKKRRQHKFYGKTAEDVREQLHEAKERRRKRRAIRDAKLTAGEWLDRWLSHRQGKVGEGTYGFYEKMVRLYLRPKLGGKPLAGLTVLDVEDLLAALARDGLSADARRKALGALRTALKAAVAAHLLFENVAAGVAKPAAERKEVAWYTEAEAIRVLAAAHALRGHRLAAVYDLCLDGGFRQGEVLGLHWPVVDWEAGAVRVEKSLFEKNSTRRLKDPKSKAGLRTVRLAPRTMRALAAHRERMRAEGRDVDRGPVFVNKPGGYVAKPALYRTYLRVLKAAGVRRLRFHCLRHTSATLLLRRGASLKMVSKRLGHEGVEITLGYYVGVLPDDQDQATGIVEQMLNYE